jgi:hypothetical protein
MSIMPFCFSVGLGDHQLAARELLRVDARVAQQF